MKNISIPVKAILIGLFLAAPLFAAADPGNGNQNGNGNGGNGNHYGWGGNNNGWGNGNNGWGNGNNGNGNNVPLDGGLSLLAAAGIGYGIKKYSGSRKQNNK